MIVRWISLLLIYCGYTTAMAELIAEPTTVPISALAKSHWMKDIYGGDEIWVFKNTGKFFEILDQFDTPTEIQDQIRIQLGTHPSHYQKTQAFSFYSLNDVVNAYYGQMTISLELKSQIPEEALGAIYALINQSQPQLPFVTAANLKQLQHLLTDWNVPPAIKQLTLASSFESIGEIKVFITPEIWNLYPDTLKEEYLSNRTSYFTQSNFSFNLKLTDFLPPSGMPYAQAIADRINQYEPHGGTHCYTCALSVYMKPMLNHGYLSEPEMQNHVQENFYRVPNSETPRPLDLILLKNEKGKILHASVYIAKTPEDHIVFTKNGVSKFSPFTFEGLSSNMGIFAWKEMVLKEVYRFRDNRLPISQNQLCSDLLTRKH